jgi:hypothetical protein
MADIDRIKAEIADIGRRPKNATVAEIEQVIDQLESVGYQVKRRNARHGRLFSVSSTSGSARFMVNHHNPGSKQAKSYSVREFINAMMDLGLYE